MSVGPMHKVVACTGSLTLPRADEFRDLIVAALGGDDDLIVDTTAASEADLSFLQIIVAARRTARRLGRRVHLRAPPDGPLMAAARAAGLSLCETDQPGGADA